MQTNDASTNWLVARIMDDQLDRAFAKYARGVLVDIGCATKPYEAALAPFVTRHIGVEYPGTLHDQSKIDVFADAYDTTLPTESADTVLSSAVLEHLERPQDAMNEAARLLRPGGHLILTAPFFWQEHEAPRDFYRYTRFGLAHLMQTAGLEPVEIIPLAGYYTKAAQEFCYFIDWRRSGPWKRPVEFVQWAAQTFAYRMYRSGRDHAAQHCWMHLAVGQKR